MQKLEGNSGLFEMSNIFMKRKVFTRQLRLQFVKTVTINGRHITING